MSLTTKEVCICDQCGIERNKDPNHWWVILRNVVIASEDISGARSYTAVSRPNGFAFVAWDDAAARRAATKHLCGLTCLYKAIDKLAQEILEQERVKA